MQRARPSLPRLAALLALGAAAAGCFDLKKAPSWTPPTTTPLPDTCYDGGRDGDETDVDCGGSCGGCGYGQACGGPGDCAAGDCVAGRCQPPSGSLCYDHARDGDESDVDCGGSCPRCGAGEACGGAADCESGSCTAGSCDPGGPFSFAAARFADTGGRGCVALAVADLDGDRRQDVIVANLATDNVSVLLGRGDGTLGAATVLEAGPQPTWVGAADLTSDGVPDLVVLPQAGSPQALVLPGLGGGRFGAARSVALPAGPGPSQALLVDLDLDGRVDLVTASGGSLPVILPGRGDGTFGAPRRPLAPDDGGFAYAALAAALVDGDGWPDLVSGGPPLRLLRGPDLRGSDIATPLATPFSLAVGALRPGGAVDVVGASAVDGQVQVWLGRGDGTFATGQLLRVGSQPSSVVVADLDGDGHPDLCTGNPGGGDISLLRGLGDGRFDTAIERWVGGSLQQIVAADMNGDGRPDLVMTDYFSHDVGVLLNTHK